MNNPFDALDSIFQATWALKVVDLHKLELPSISWTGLDHGVAFGEGAGCAADAETAGEERVDDVGADEARCAGDEDELAFHV